MLVGAIALLGAGIGLWYVTMPYPIGLWWEACWGVPYANEWPISESDYATAKNLVEQKLGWRHIITDARVVGPDKVEIITTISREHDSSGTDQIFVVRRVDGRWELDNCVRFRFRMVPYSPLPAAQPEATPSGRHCPRDPGQSAEERNAATLVATWLAPPLPPVTHRGVQSPLRGSPGGLACVSVHGLAPRGYYHAALWA